MSAPYYQDDGVTVYHGDCIGVMRSMPDASVHAVVTDPPYGLEFMGREWDGANGFRRSLNEADAGRDSVFGRTSATSPEYRTSRKAAAGMSKPGIGDRNIPWPSHVGGLNPKCRNCDKWQRGGNPCSCDAPDFPNERLPRLHEFQDWCEIWATEALRVLKPGGYLLAFGGSRTWHRLASAVEDAGFEIRDSIAWLYGSGFPKSLDVSKAIDKAAGADREIPASRNAAGEKFGFGGGIAGRADATWICDRCGRSRGSQSGNCQCDLTGAPVTGAAQEWEGWGTALKPAFEPIVVGRKPLGGWSSRECELCDGEGHHVDQDADEVECYRCHGTGSESIQVPATVAANVVAHGTGAIHIDAVRVGDSPREVFVSSGEVVSGNASMSGPNTGRIATGRWPTNVVLDESQAAELDAYGDSGGASRFFPTFRYEAKAPGTERPDVGGTQHPTVKPLDLMRWLVRLVTPTGGTVLEPFAGSGTTLEAALIEGFNVIGIEREESYLPLIMQRIKKPLQQSLLGDWDGAA